MGEVPVADVTNVAVCPAFTAAFAGCTLNDGGTGFVMPEQPAKEDAARTAVSWKARIVWRTS